MSDTALKVGIALVILFIVFCLIMAGVSAATEYGEMLVCETQGGILVDGAGFTPNVCVDREAVIE